MALSQSVQTQISFKHLHGKSHTDSARDLFNEPYGINFNIQSDNVWTSRISSTPSISVLSGVTVNVLADLSPIDGSNGHSFVTKWPSTPPNAIDFNLGTSFSYGQGSLIGITGGDRMTNLISDYYGSGYFAVPYIGIGTNPIEGLDIKRWTYQYNSGILYQDNVIGSDPTTIHVYPYLGSKFDLPENRDNIRVTATGSTDFVTSTTNYFSLTVDPIITTYSTNHLYLTDFSNYHFFGSVNLNIANLGTFSVYKWESGSWIDLIYGDIVPGRVYYLSWNGSFFQFGDTNPITGANNFSFPNDTSFDVGGIGVGSRFDNVRLTEMFTSIFYGDQQGGITSLSLTKPSGVVTNLEVGDNLPASPMTFSWTLDPPYLYDENVAQVQRVGVETLTYDGLKNGPYTWINTATISYTFSNTEKFRVYLRKYTGVWIMEELAVNWINPIYYGSTTSATVSNASGMTKVLATNSNFTLTIPGSGYKYIYIPASYSSIYSLVNNGLQVSMASTANGYTSSDVKVGSFGTTYSSFHYNLVDIGNAFGVTHSYRVFRTEYQISSPLTVTSKDSL